MGGRYILKQVDTGVLIITPVDANMREWKLVEPITICIEDGRCWTIPKGFRTDFASVPKIFWNILPPFGRYGKAALLHDYFYRTQIIPRKEADKIFLEAMLMMGVPAWKAYIMYWAVRLFGWKAWLENKKKLKEVKRANKRI